MTNEFKFLPKFSPLFYSDKTYFIIYSGRSAGKSYNIAAYLLMKLMSNEPNRIIVSRYTSRSLTNSIYQNIIDHINEWNIGQFLRVTGDTIENKLNNNVLLTHSMKLADGTQSAKGKGFADANILFIDEAYELPSEEEYIKLVDSFRVKDRKIQIICAFNPGSKQSWIFKRWFLPDSIPNYSKWGDTHEFIYTSYLDNIDNISPIKVKEWNDSQFTDKDYYDHHIMGKFLDVGHGQVFKNWIWKWPSKSILDSCKEITIGLDFGFSQDPSSCVRTYKDGKKLYIEEILYERGLIIEDLASELLRKGIKYTDIIIADSADPTAIETLRRLGFRNIRGAKKGADSIRIGIDNIKSYQIYANPTSLNLIDEYNNYNYNSVGKPVGPDHQMDALRYSLSDTGGGDGQYGFAKKTNNPFESLRRY